MVFLSLVLLLVITKGLVSGAAITRKMMVPEDKPYMHSGQRATQHGKRRGGGKELSPG